MYVALFIYFLAAAAAGVAGVAGVVGITFMQQMYCTNHSNTDTI